MAIPDDPKDMTDSELNALVVQYQIEQTRRGLLRDCPPQVTTITRSYLSSGGDLQTMLQAVNAAVESPQHLI